MSCLVLASLICGTLQEDQRSLSSDWTVNSFIMFVCEKFVKFLSRVLLKKISKSTIIELFTDQ